MNSPLFTTLCGVDACMIVYGPNHRDRSLAETWPENKEVHRVLSRYCQKNHNSECSMWDDHINKLPEDQLKQFSNELDDKIDSIQKKIEWTGSNGIKACQRKNREWSSKNMQQWIKHHVMYNLLLT
ncbi:hypothetical protein IFM89_016324 [Coptis chinensis]|uniref:Uncharacterized protein n=1 Tax=Coptis chinensis TaxID=261450 RepID=A0A835HFH7_9MAGN|nr:hypothetical protein IFM89_016324 [Coptis chinensis]